MDSNIKRTILVKGLILCLVPLMMQIALVFALVKVIHQTESEVDNQMRLRAILDRSHIISRLYYDAGVAMGGYSVSKSSVFMDRYNRIVNQLPIDLEALSQLVKDDREKSNTVEKIKKLVSDGLTLLTDTKKFVDDNRADIAEYKARNTYQRTKKSANDLQDAFTELNGPSLTFDPEYPNAGLSYEGSYKSWLSVAFPACLIISFLLMLQFSRSLNKLFKENQNN